MIQFKEWLLERITPAPGVDVADILTARDAAKEGIVSYQKYLANIRAKRGVAYSTKLHRAVEATPLREETRVTIETGLTRDEAKKISRKKVHGDYRGFTYDPKTGIAIWI